MATGSTAKPGGPELPAAPQADPANPNTPASQTTVQALRPESSSTPAAHTPDLDEHIIASSFGSGSTPAVGSAEEAAERQHFAALLRAGGSLASQPAAPQSMAVTPQQQPERTREGSSGPATGPLGRSAALEEAAGGSSDAQAMSEGEAGGSPVTPQTAGAAGSSPEVFLEGVEPGVSAPETEPVRLPEQELAHQPDTQLPDQRGSPGQTSALRCAAEAAGPSTASPMPELVEALEQQQEEPQVSSAAPEQAQAAPAPEATLPEDSSVRRGAVNQPHRASRHAHPKPLEAAVLTISDAVLCSEMGVHFSPCGRLLAACVACQVSRPHHCCLLHLCRCMP